MMVRVLLYGYCILQLAGDPGEDLRGYRVSVLGGRRTMLASQHKARSYERMSEGEKKLQAEVEALLQRAEAADAAQDEKYGKDQAGDELPAELARGESRLTKRHLSRMLCLRGPCGGLEA